MCLISIAWRAHPRYRLVLLANRDEEFGRPTAAAAFWSERPDILGGRDLRAGGTWLGVAADGRFGALTSFRRPADKRDGAPSRGELVSGYLTGGDAPAEYVRAVASRSAEYNGFNLLVGDGDSLLSFSNRGNGVEPVEPGVHGLSNHLLDTPWPKVQRAKRRLADLVGRTFGIEEGFQLLDDTERAARPELPDTGMGIEAEERLSAIRLPAEGGYGTRCSTVLLLGEDGSIEFAERTWGEDQAAKGTVSFRLGPEEARARAASRHAVSPPRETPLPVR